MGMGGCVCFVYVNTTRGALFIFTKGEKKKKKILKPYEREKKKKS